MKLVKCANCGCVFEGSIIAWYCGELCRAQAYNRRQRDRLMQEAERKRQEAGTIEQEKRDQIVADAIRGTE
jgi:hypothetical protein